MSGPQLEPHSCPPPQSPAGRILPSVLLPHSPTNSGLRTPSQGKNWKHKKTTRETKGEDWEGNRKIEGNEEQKKPETLSNSRDKRTVGSQTKWLAEVAREGLSRWPLRDGRADGAGGGRRAAGGPQGAGEVLPPPPARCPGRSAPHFTPRRPRPRLCGAGNTPRRPARTCSFLAAPSLPPGRPLSPSRSPRPEPTTGHRWMGRPEPGVLRKGSAA